MGQYVMFTFYTGHCRMERITRKRPAAVIRAELQARFGNQGTMTTAIEVTEKIGTTEAWPEDKHRAGRFGR